MIRLGAIVFCVAVLLGAPGLTQVAYAGSGGTSTGQSAAQQYVEGVPTASGGGSPRSHKAGATTKPVPVAPAVSHSIARQGGSDAAALREVASSAALGAPRVSSSHSSPASKTHKGGSTASGKGRRTATGPRVTRQSPFVAAFNIAHGLPVILLLVALAAIAVANAIARRGPLQAK